MTEPVSKSHHSNKLFMSGVVALVGVAVVGVTVLAATSPELHSNRSKAAPPPIQRPPGGTPNITITLYGAPHVRHPLNTPYFTLRWGDVNGDGYVNVIDAQNITRFLADLDPFRPDQLWHADTSGDGVITQEDVDNILQLEVGLIEELPVVSNSIYPELVPGDVDDNGQVNVLDALAIMQYLANTEILTPAQAWSADVNGDGRISEADSNAIMELEVGLISILPVEVTGRDLGATAVDAQGNNITDSLIITSNVDVATPGNYRILFSIPGENSPVVQRHLNVR